MQLRLTFCSTAITCVVLTAPIAANASITPLALPGPVAHLTGKTIVEEGPVVELASGGGGNSGHGSDNSGHGNSGSDNSGHGSDNSGHGNSGNDDSGHGNGGHGGDNSGPGNGSGNGGGKDESGSGRSKPRVPGGSGCDDPGEVEEHPECSA